VTDEEALQKPIADTHAAHGRIDILHSHAGIRVDGSLEEVSVQGLDESYGLNVRPHFVAARAVVPHMKAQGSGSIVNTSSNSGGLSRYGHARLCRHQGRRDHDDQAGRARLRQVQHPLQCALSGLGRYALHRALYPPDGRGREAIEKYVSETIPMGRWANIEEIAESILFLASDRSSFMTGHALVDDGGECIA